MSCVCEREMEKERRKREAEKTDTDIHWVTLQMSSKDNGLKPGVRDSVQVFHSTTWTITARVCIAGNCNQDPEPVNKPTQSDMGHGHPMWIFTARSSAGLHPLFSTSLFSISKNHSKKNHEVSLFSPWIIYFYKQASFPLWKNDF